MEIEAQIPSSPDRLRAAHAGHAAARAPDAQAPDLRRSRVERAGAIPRRYKDTIAALSFVPSHDIPKRTISSWGDLSRVQPADPTR